MEQDKQLKKILSYSAEKSSADFTETVMNRVQQLSPTGFCYQPLVPDKLKRAFVFIFVGVVFGIFILCLMIQPPNLPFMSWIENLQFPDFSYNKILMFILSFWFVFTANNIIRKHKFLSTRRDLL